MQGSLRRKSCSGCGGLRMPGSGKPICAQTLDKLLRNPIYCGGITSTASDVEVRGDFAPIVYEGCFRRTAERLWAGSSQRQVRSKHNIDFPLRVFIRCAACGVPLTGSSTTSRSGRRYPYYSCRTTGCKTANIGRDALHKMFIEFRYGLFPKQSLMDRFRSVVTVVWQKRHSERERERDRALERKSALEKRRQRVIDLLVEGTLKKFEYEDQMIQIGTAMQEVERHIQSTLISEADLERLLDFSEWLLERVRGIWNAAELPNKLRLQQALFRNGLTLPADGFGTAQHPFFFKSSTLLTDVPDDLASPGGVTRNRRIECFPPSVANRFQWHSSARRRRRKSRISVSMIYGTRPRPGFEWRVRTFTPSRNCSGIRTCGWRRDISTCPRRSSRTR